MFIRPREFNRSNFESTYVPKTSLTHTHIYSFTRPKDDFVIKDKIVWNSLNLESKRHKGVKKSIRKKSPTPYLVSLSFPWLHVVVVVTTLRFNLKHKED